MINEYDRVRIKYNGVTGEVVDIYEAKGVVYYTVESDDRDVPGGFGEDGWWKLFTCEAKDLEKI